MIKKENIKSLYYITHVDNIKSILEQGIFSHNKIKNLNIKPKSIYDANVISRRENKNLPSGNTLLEYANLYFQPRNPMMYRILHDLGKGNFTKGVKSIALLEIKKNILDNSDLDCYVSTGNAATDYSEFLDIPKGLKKIDKVVLNDNAWWNDLSNGKSKIMAEFLIKDKIPSAYISSVYFGHEDVKKKLSDIKPSINLILDKTKFFLPKWKSKISENITLVQGDMFFSSAQVLTISVNTVGVMGKGLASRARYQFTDVFVEYQDLCRSKKLKMGKPCLIKRDKSMDELLAEQPENLKNKNFNKWFLLFPTKNHWKEDSDYEGIKKGLDWLVKSCQKDKTIQSIALPALGCGLGNLTWGEIGPLMCQALEKINIPIFIYLPMDNNIAEEQLNSDFLLGGS